MINWSVNGGLISFYEWLDWVLVSFFMTSLFVYFLVWFLSPFVQFDPDNGHHDMVLDLYWWFALILSNRSIPYLFVQNWILSIFGCNLLWFVICNPVFYSFIGHSYFCRNVYPCLVERDNCTNGVWCTLTADPNP